MSQNPLENALTTCKSFASFVQTKLSGLFIPYEPSGTKATPPKSVLPIHPSNGSDHLVPLQPVQASADTAVSSSAKKGSAEPLTKESLGRATWTLLHAVAAQYPEQPTRQQKRDVKELMTIISRVYPCKECSSHFKEIIKANPVQAESHAEFSQWLCHIHNIVNRSLGKATFPCQRVNARWGQLDCPERTCEVDGGSDII